ncbi:unnamed protein product, partial [Ectocarpus sp. 13 AM-2016]
VDLSEKKSFLKETVTAIMSEGDDEEEEEEQEEEEVEEEEEEEEEPASKAKAKRKSASFQLSPALYEFMGSKETCMARGDVTKAVWAYIRAESLQDPKDGRKIRNDEKMFRVFKCKTMNMMHIAKKLSPHLKKLSDLVESGGGAPDEEVDNEASSSDDEEPRRTAGSKKRGASGAKSEPTTKAGATPKGRPKAGAGGGSAKGKKGGGGGKEESEVASKKTRKPSTVMWRVSDELAAVVGSKDATVDTIRSGVHQYIKEHNLQ